MNFVFQYMSENGIIEKGEFIISKGKFPQSVVLYMNGRVPYGALPKGSRVLSSIMYDKGESGYITKLTDDIPQYDGINGWDEDTQKSLIAKVLMSIRIESEYKTVLQDQVKHLRTSPNDIYETLNRDAIKYAIYKEIVSIVKHRDCVGKVEGPFISKAITLHSKDSLLDRIYEMTKDNVLLDLEDNAFKNVSAIGHYSK